MGSTNIIKAELSDAKEIAKLIIDGWNATYKGIISDEYLKNMDIQELSENWKNKIKSNDNSYVYKEDNKILGVIIFGKSEEDNTNDIGEIFVLYVRPELKRKGIGTQLLNFAKNKLINEGYAKMIIWCLIGNIQGANFYKKMRWYKNKRKGLYIRWNTDKRRKLYV